MSIFTSREFVVMFALLLLSCITACSSKEAPPPVVVNFSNTTTNPVSSSVDPKSTAVDETRNSQDDDGNQDDMARTGYSENMSKNGHQARETQRAVNNRHADVRSSRPANSSVNTPVAMPVSTQRPGMIISQQTDEASFFNTQIHDLANQLIQNFRGETSPDFPIAITTFVDLNHFYKTSPFGRYLAEQLMGELQRAGFRVLEIRKTDSILIKERYGEYSLSRDIQEIAKESMAQLVLIGTYMMRGKYVLVNARLVSNEGNLLSSSGMKILRRDSFLDSMLWPSSAPKLDPKVRIPIKSMGEPTEVRIISGS